MISAVPFEALVTQSKCVAIRGRKGCTGRGPAPFGGGEIEPPGPKARGTLQVIKPDVDVVLRQVTIFRDDVGAGAGEIGHSQLADLHVEILDPASVAAHVERIEIIDLDMLAAIVPLARPKLGVGLALDDIAGLHKSFAKPELIIARAI